MMVALNTAGFRQGALYGALVFYLTVLQGASTGALVLHGTFLLCLCYIVRMFFVQLYENFMVFLLHTL